MVYKSFATTLPETAPGSKREETTMRVGSRAVSAAVWSPLPNDRREAFFRPRPLLFIYIFTLPTSSFTWKFRTLVSGQIGVDVRNRTFLCNGKTTTGYVCLGFRKQAPNIRGWFAFQLFAGDNEVGEEGWTDLCGGISVGGQGWSVPQGKIVARTFLHNSTKCCRSI